MLRGFTEQILALYEKAILEISHFRNSSNGKLIIGASTTLGEYVLPRIISTFRKEDGGVDIYLKVANTNQILKQLSANAFNLALVEDKIDNHSFSVEKVYEDELILITSTSHLWTSKKQIEISELLSEPIIIREEGSGTRKIMEEILTKYGIKLSDLNIKMELDSTEAVKSAVAENLGISFVAKSSFIKKPENIDIIPIANIDSRFDFNLIYSREKELTSLTTEFIDCLKERLSNQFREMGIFNSCL
ncbi:MAG: LysR substrate-binding domain-containing protein [bacterium]